MGVTCGAGEGCRKETERKLKCCAGQDEEVDVTCGAGGGCWAETERKLSVLCRAAGQGGSAAFRVWWKRAFSTGRGAGVSIL